MSSPAMSFFFIISRSFSMSSDASPFMNPQSSAIFWAMWIFLSVMTPPQITKGLYNTLCYDLGKNSSPREPEMCGRFVLMTPGKDLAKWFGLEEIPDLEFRYNIAPTQMVAIIRLNPETLQKR